MFKESLINRIVYKLDKSGIIEHQNELQAFSRLFHDIIKGKVKLNHINYKAFLKAYFQSWHIKDAIEYGLFFAMYCYITYPFLMEIYLDDFELKYQNVSIAEIYFSNYSE